MALIRAHKFIEKHQDKGFSAGGVRWEIFNAERNGLAAEGIVIRHGRKVYIEEEKYFERLRQHTAGAA